MNKLKLMLMAFAIFTAAQINAQAFKADTRASSLKWHGKKVTGEHFGTISLKEGGFILENNQIARGKFIIDMKSITNTDLTDAAYNQKLVGHLKSDDFFGVEKHPEAVLEILKSTVFKNNQATVNANLTIKSITHPITFVVIREGDTFKAEIIVDRSKYDVRYGSDSFFDGLGDKMIYDEFTMTVELRMIPAKDIDS